MVLAASASTHRSDSKCLSVAAAATVDSAVAAVVAETIAVATAATVAAVVDAGARSPAPDSAGLS